MTAAEVIQAEFDGWSCKLGPRVKVTFANPDKPDATFVVDCLVDTGAACSSINRALAGQLKDSGDQWNLKQGNYSTPCTVYVALVTIGGVPLPHPWRIGGHPEAFEYDGVIGMDILKCCKCAYDGASNSFNMEVVQTADK